MNKKIKVFLLLIVCSIILSACNMTVDNKPVESGHKQDRKEINHETEEKLVWLTKMQQKAIGLTLGSIEKQDLNTSVKITGKLALAPQHQAEVSTFIGGNVKKIMVKEGAYVTKGNLLALLEHPDYIELQQEFQQITSSLIYLEAEYQRKKTLYDKEVGSAKDYQKISAEYQSARAKSQGLEEKLRLLGLNSAKIREGNLFTTIAVTSPINGYVKAIHTRMGQYAVPEIGLFEIINTTQVHADFMVYEKDISKVKEGQLIRFTVADQPDKIFKAKIYAIGPDFEDISRAIHVHAHIITPVKKLLPGMYINGRLQVNEIKLNTLPESAIVNDGEKTYIFVKTRQQDTVSAFRKTEVITGISDQGYTAIRVLMPLSDSVLAVTKGAYYLQADMDKGENEHAH